MIARHTATMLIRLLLTVGVFAIFAVMSYAVLTGQVTTAQVLRDVVMVIIGAIITQFNNAMNYWLGTSQGSADKTQELSASGNRQPEQRK